MKFNELVDVIKEKVADILELDFDEVSSDDDFYELGIASIDAIKILNSVSKTIGKELNVSVIFECETIEDLANCVLRQADCVAI